MRFWARPRSVSLAGMVIISFYLIEPACADTSAARPDAELLAAAREARDAKQFALAEALAREGVARFQEPAWPLTLALILADEGKSSEALAVLGAPWPGGLPKIERLMAEGYASQRGGDPWGAMTAYGEVLLAQPGNAEAKEALATAMAEVRAPHGAEAVAGANLGRDADRAAALVRWEDTLPAASLAARFAETDKSLSLLDSLVAKAVEAKPADDALTRRLRIDRVLALRDRFRMPEVIAEAQSLSADAPLPSYAIEALADALLYERRPAEALVAYETVLKADPKKLQALYGRVFALVETERLNAARAAADIIVAQQPPFVAYDEGPATYSNLERGYAETLAAEVRVWGNDIDNGYAALEKLVDAAPASPTIRRAYVSGVQARGWRRRAEQEAAIAATLDPGSLPTRIMLADVDLSRNRLQDARAAVDRLIVLAPEDRRVQRLSDEVAAARGWLIEADLGPSWNDGGGANTSGREWTSSLRAQSPQFTRGTSLFALADGSIAHPVEGRVSRDRVGGGVAFQGADLGATVYATTSWGTHAGEGVGFSIDWQPADQLSFGVAGETFSRQTPLRALFYGITANSVSSTLKWRRNEATSIALGGEWLSYSDGNDALSASLVGEQQLWTGPHVDITGRSGVWYTQNSQQGGPYFSPNWVISGTAGVMVRQIAWRRYEKLFSHALSFEYGLQDQSGYSTHWIGSISYEHRWRTDPWWELYYSAMVYRRVYDGDPERGIGFRVGFRRRI